MCVCVCKLKNVCMYVCTGMYMYVVPVEVRKLCQISWSHSYRQRAALDAGSTLASSAKRGRSYLLNHLFSPYHRILLSHSKGCFDAE